METLREKLAKLGRESLLKLISKRQHSNVETPTPSYEDIFGEKEYTEDEKRYGVIRQGYSDKQKMDFIRNIYDPTDIFAIGKIKKLDKFLRSARGKGPFKTMDEADQGRQFLRGMNETSRKIRKMKAENQYIDDVIEEAVEKVGLKNRAIVEQLLKKIKN